MKKILVMSIFLTSSFVVSGSEILVIASDGKEEKIEKHSSKSIQESLKKINQSKNEAVLRSLENFQNKSKWKVSKVSIGLGLSGEAGIGPWNLGLAIKQRLVYTPKLEGKE